MHWYAAVFLSDFEPWLFSADAPANVVYSRSHIVGVFGVPILASTIAPVGLPPFSFSIFPRLPAGLQIDAHNGTIFGTPANVANGSWIVTVSNSAGAVNTTVHITLTALAPSSLVLSSPAAQFLKIGVNYPTVQA